MEIKNLEINILYHLCEHLEHGRSGHSVPRQMIVELFSDIPENQLDSAINTLAVKRLLQPHEHGARLSITREGIDYLQSTAICQISQPDECNCGTSHQWGSVS
jgi:hypothetical protein